MSWAKWPSLQLTHLYFLLKPFLKTAYWHTDNFYLQLLKYNSNIIVELRSKPAQVQPDLEEACREFCNMLVDNQTRQFVIAETGKIRDTLLKKAFFEAKKSPIKGSNESFIPENQDSYNRDPLRIKDLC